MGETLVSTNRYFNKDWNMDHDIKFFGGKEIQKINSTKGINFQLELEDTHERYIDTKEFHIVRVIWKDLEGRKLLTEELFEKGLNPYLYGVRTTSQLMKKGN